MALRSLLGCALGTVALPAFASPDEVLRPKVRPKGLSDSPYSPLAGIVKEANFSGDSCAVLYDARNGKILEEFNATEPMAPASVAKTITSMYALEHLGPGFRFATRILATGMIENGVLKGDLILVGGGDPEMDTQDLGSLANAIRASGIQEVDGDYLYYSDVLPTARSIDPGQPYEVSYNPGLSGLNLDFNRVNFEWKKEGGKWDITMSAPARAYRPDVQISTMQVVDRSGPIFTYEDKNGRDVWTVAEGALGKGGARWLPVTRPAAYTAEVFATLVGANGTDLKAPRQVHALPQDAYQLALHESRALSDILREMLYYSTNVTAEIIGLTTTAKILGKPPESIPASAKVLSAWARQKFGMQQIDMVDHCGLGDASRVSAHDIAGMLCTSDAQNLLHPLLKKIPLRDRGKTVDRNRPMQVQAKTGTLNFVSALAGYETGPDGRKLVFAIISNDISKRDVLSREQKEHPPGGKAWLYRARKLQQDLIERWGGMYGT